jgi:hypothetical protein
MRSLNVLHTKNYSLFQFVRPMPYWSRPTVSTHTLDYFPPRKPSFGAYQKLTTLIFVVGRAPHCSWIPALRDLPATLTRLDWETVPHLLTQKDAQIGNLTDYCPNLTDLSIVVNDSNLIPPDLLIGFLPPQLTSFRFNITLQQEFDAWNAIARLPANLTRFSLLMLYAPHARLINNTLCERHYNIPLPRTITDLRLHPYTLHPKLQETEFGWKIPISRLDLDSISPKGCQILPNSVTKLVVRNSNACLAEWPKDVLPGLKSLEIQAQFEKVDSLPPSLTMFRNTRNYQLTLDTDLSKSIFCNGSISHKCLTRLEFPNTLWPEVLLAQLPSTMRELLVESIGLDGSSIPEGETVVEEMGDLLEWFLKKRRETSRGFVISFSNPDTPFQLAPTLSLPNHIEECALVTNARHWMNGYPLQLKSLLNFTYFNLDFSIPQSVTHLSFDPTLPFGTKELFFSYFLKGHPKLRVVENGFFHVSELGLNSLQTIPLVELSDGKTRTRLRIPEDIIEHHYEAFPEIRFVNCHFNTSTIFAPPQSVLPYVVQELELNGIFEMDLCWEKKTMFKSGLLRFSHVNGGFKGWFPPNTGSPLKDYFLPSLPSTVTQVSLHHFSAHAFLFDNEAMVRQWVGPIAKSLHILEIDAAAGFDHADCQYKTTNFSNLTLPTNLLTQLRKIKIKLPRACTQTFQAKGHTIIQALPSQLDSIEISEDGYLLTAICTDPKKIPKPSDCSVM